ncbi:MAG: hypothetical protein M3296_01795 [Actinomycetota bacterium]|nr:hypothetical protein [Actinomycetota bacterium]
MGYYLRKQLGARAGTLSRDELLEVADAALAMQVQLARDVMAVAELTSLPDEHKATDQRVIRSVETIRQLTM